MTVDLNCTSKDRYCHVMYSQPHQTLIYLHIVKIFNACHMTPIAVGDIVQPTSVVNKFSSFHGAHCNKKVLSSTLKLCVMECFC